MARRKKPEFDDPEQWITQGGGDAVSDENSRTQKRLARKDLQNQLDQTVNRLAKLSVAKLESLELDEDIVAGVRAIPSMKKGALARQRRTMARRLRTVDLEALLRALDAMGA